MKGTNESTPHLLEGLQDAIANGYCHHFTLLADGSLECHSNPTKIYELEELNITVLTCLDSKASLYLIVSNDGTMGHMIEYWEHS